SAINGENVGELLAKIEQLLDAGMRDYRLLIPFSNYGLLNRLRGMGSVLSQEHGEEGVTVMIRADEKDVNFACREGATLLENER
ncbi:MAG: hypothetical protein RSC98_07860, partial [Clostridia bacterium]